ncbi:MAG: hypothetical protein IT165_23415 [Bryobacterales bacterium]|nr:hypothetical protein [Bryobacterales bacterium]
MAHADSLKRVINHFAPLVLAPVPVKGLKPKPSVVALNASDALDQWAALHLLQDNLGLFDSATCYDATVWKDLNSAWKQFLAHAHFDCKGNGSPFKRSFSVRIEPLAGKFYSLSIIDWASPHATGRATGEVVPFTNNPGEDRVTVKDVSAARPPSNPADYGYYGNPQIET